MQVKEAKTAATLEEVKEADIVSVEKAVVEVAKSAPEMVASVGWFSGWFSAAPSALATNTEEKKA